jgi:hypothetical protein
MSAAVAPAPPPKVFISYSWVPAANKRWVAELAARLRTNDSIDVRLDQWEVVPGDQVPHFMEKAVRDSDFVLIICTSRYRERADDRLGGIGYEGDILTAKVFKGASRRKFIPLLRGEPDESVPTWLLGSDILDFRGRPYPLASYTRLVQALKGTLPKAPPLGKKKKPDTQTASTRSPRRSR